MDIKKLFNDDDAVSPVIGVILMVAITVILAAVIASFVLGLGNEATNSAPTSSFTFNYETVDQNSGDDWGIVKVSHDGGDTIAEDELYLRGSGFNQSGTNQGVHVGSLSWDGGASTGDLEDFGQDAENTQLHHSSAGEWNGTKSGDDSAIVSGDFANVYVASDFDISVNYESTEGTSSATLQSKKGPDA